MFIIILGCWTEIPSYELQVMKRRSHLRLSRRPSLSQSPTKNRTCDLGISLYKLSSFLSLCSIFPQMSTLNSLIRKLITLTFTLRSYWVSFPIHMISLIPHYFACIMNTIIVLNKYKTTYNRALEANIYIHIYTYENLFSLRKNVLTQKARPFSKELRKYWQQTETVPFQINQEFYQSMNISSSAESSLISNRQ